MSSLTGDARRLSSLPPLPSCSDDIAETSVLGAEKTGQSSADMEMRRNKARAAWISRDVRINKQSAVVPDSSVGKEPACNARDPRSIPGSGGSPGEGIGYPLQLSWASLVAQLVKNPPAMRETWVLSLDWEGPLEKGTATHFSILA